MWQRFGQVKRAASILLPILVTACGLSDGPEKNAPDAGDTSATVQQREASWRPNVLLISIDTLRADRLGCYGYDRETSPNIDRLASEGALFEHTYAPKSSTSPSLASLHTSLWPVTHGVRYNGMKMDPVHRQIAESFKEAGYSTAAVVGNAAKQNWKGLDSFDFIRTEPRDVGITSKAVTWLNNHPEKFFLWVHYFSPHAPYEPREGFRDFVDPNYAGTLDGGFKRLDDVFLAQEQLNDADLSHVNGLYDGEVASVDQLVGQLITNLTRLEVLDDTIIVITADHGEELYEHHCYFFHQASIYEGALRVPLVIRFPGIVPAGTRIPTFVSLLDVAPTILALAGLESPVTFQGRDLSSAFTGTPLEPKTVFGEWGDKMLIARTEKFKYIYNPSHWQPPIKRENEVSDGKAPSNELLSMPIKTEELYAIAEDPRELTELSAELPDTVTEMRAHIEAFQAQYNWILNDEEVEKRKGEMDPETVRELENLGYVQ